MFEMPVDEPDRTWWHDGVLYQIYPRSYMDANGDGVGDLRGIIERLDYLQWLGVDGIWLDPISVSPNTDWGYDVADYCDVDPALGTLADADELIAEAGRRGIRIVLDMVPNHTSDQHPWFVDARSSRDSEHRDWYVWADARPDGSPPEQLGQHLRPACGRRGRFDDGTGQFYLHNFLPSQPDLNWWNEDVRAAFDAIYRFWYDRGVAGFRLDVAHTVIKDRELRDNPPSTADDHPYVRMRGQRQDVQLDAARKCTRCCAVGARSRTPTIHPASSSAKRTCSSPRCSRRSTAQGDEVNLAFNLMFLHAKFDATEIRGIVDSAERLIPAGSQPTWAAGSHDNRRFATRWCGDDPRKTRAAMLMMLTLRGTPFLYYGDELGMPETEIPVERVLDPVGKIHGPRIGRDGERTPMQWTDAPGAGFTARGVEPWLPFGDSVHVQRRAAAPRSRLDAVVHP